MPSKRIRLASCSTRGAELSGRSVDRLKYRIRNGRKPSIGADRKRVGERWRIGSDISMIHAMPHGKNHLTAANLSCYQAREFPRWPSFLKEILAENNYAIFGLC